MKKHMQGLLSHRRLLNSEFHQNFQLFQAKDQQDSEEKENASSFCPESENMLRKLIN